MLRLLQRLRAEDKFRQLEYLNNKPLRYTVAFVFAGFNVISLYTSALPADRNTISRKYWPASIGVVAGLGFIYWVFFPLLRLKVDREGKRLGQAYLGLEIKYDNENEPIDPNLDDHVRYILQDYNKRRVGYKVSSFIFILATC